MSKMDVSDEIVIAILAKDKAHVLPYFLQAILNQTYPKDKLHLYIRTNDNTDSTTTVLEEFIRANGDSYASIYYNSDSISESLTQYSQHEWNCLRFKILGKIRQQSIDHARLLNAHYFVADCDNFISPSCLNDMFSIRELGVVAPLLRSRTAYSNYHHSVTDSGYYKDSHLYHTILRNEIRGCLEVAVVHCTYFISKDLLHEICYDDDSGRYEYVIFSDVLRKKKIPQYIDNRQEYGTLTFAETREDFLKESALHACLIQNPQPE
jgi:hypothetical protein